MEEYPSPKGKVTGSNPVRDAMASRPERLAPHAEYIDKAERYLEEAKAVNKVTYEHERNEPKAQTLLLGSIAASLIALSKKQ